MIKSPEYNILALIDYGARALKIKVVSGLSKVVQNHKTLCLRQQTLLQMADCVKAFFFLLLKYYLQMTGTFNNNSYSWVKEQTDIFESITATKLDFLDELTNHHLRWFSKCTTIR
jgi:Glu-tRNA(Gln) amidotransferase subunit E-like FAD-binding protein